MFSLGRRDRRTATRAGGDRERARAAVIAGRPAADGRSNRCPTQPQTFARREPDPWGLGDQSARPLRALSAVLGDFATCGSMRNRSVYQLPLSALPTTGFSSSSSPTGALFRTPLASDSSRGGESLDKVKARRGTIALSHRIIDFFPQRTGWLFEATGRIGDTVVRDRDHVKRWGRYADAIAQWEHITGRHPPAPALLNDTTGPRPAPEFVEWLMGLDPGWVTDPTRALTPNQQITALGNGVLPVQAATALRGAQLRATLHRRRVLNPGFGGIPGPPPGRLRETNSRQDVV